MGRFRKAIRCNICQKVGLAGGLRYACLVCHDYDLCEKCYEKKRFNVNHKPYHPMQGIDPHHQEHIRSFSTWAPAVYCCPYCDDSPFSSGSLLQHCQQYHSGGGHSVRCPVCLVTKGRYQNLLKGSLLEHLVGQHRDANDSDFAGPRILAGPQCAGCSDYIRIGTRGVLYHPCLHVFHERCAASWLKSEPSLECPACCPGVHFDPWMMLYWALLLFIIFRIAFSIYERAS